MRTKRTGRWEIGHVVVNGKIPVCYTNLDTGQFEIKTVPASSVWDVVASALRTCPADDDVVCLTSGHVLGRWGQA